MLSMSAGGWRRGAMMPHAVWTALPRVVAGRALATAAVQPVTAGMARGGAGVPAGDGKAEFTVGPDNGFLPRHEPMTELPSQFKELESLLQRMPVARKDGTPGLLFNGQLAAAVQAELPEYSAAAVAKADQRLLAALYRDYTFLTSAYLLEPCDIEYRRSGNYGLGRDRLPANIARPLKAIADRLQARPFMEYAMTYALYNWKRRDLRRGLDYDNLELIRTLHGGPAEHGFILVHVAMVAHTGDLVRNTERALAAAAAKDTATLLGTLKEYHANLNIINQVMETMWARSDPNAYMKLRTFIMGIKNQPMFPNGVIYEGVDNEPKQYRGESGANDSIIPTCDNLFQLHFPRNPLTEILEDFRSYRPVDHNRFLAHVQDTSIKSDFRTVATSTPDLAVWYLANVDLVREFRQRHWNFTKEYIIKHSEHPVATGGSPITTWLPNQLGQVMRIMEGVDKQVEDMEAAGKTMTAQNREILEAIRRRYRAQLRILSREVDELSRKFGQQGTKTV